MARRRLSYRDCVPPNTCLDSALHKECEAAARLLGLEPGSGPHHGRHVKMTADAAPLDAHEPPSDELRALWKGYARVDAGELTERADVDDLLVPERAAEFRLSSAIPSTTLSRVFSDFAQDGGGCAVQVGRDAPVYHHPALPGLALPCPSSLQLPRYHCLRAHTP